jgi:hypothetical protein
MKALRVLATIFGGPFMLIGIIWVLQGLNALPGSFMTGHIIWAVYGAPLSAVGAGLVWWVNRPNTRTVLAVFAGLIVAFVGLSVLATVLANGGFDYKAR